MYTPFAYAQYCTACYDHAHVVRIRLILSAYHDHVLMPLQMQQDTVLCYATLCYGMLSWNTCCVRHRPDILSVSRLSG